MSANDRKYLGKIQENMTPNAVKSHYAIVKSDSVDTPCNGIYVTKIATSGTLQVQMDGEAVAFLRAINIDNPIIGNIKRVWATNADAGALAADADIIGVLY